MSALTEITLEDRHLAILARYSEFVFVKVETGCRNKYTISVPIEDWNTVLEQWADPKCTVEARAWMSALASVEAMEKASRVRCGVWTSSAYIKNYVPKRHRTDTTAYTTAYTG